MAGGPGAVLFFGFGLAAGVLIAFAGAGFVEGSAAAIVSIFLGVLMLVLILGIALYAARRPIWTRLFGYAEVQLQSLAEPLSKVAERAIDRDPAGATQAARDLVAMVLARYSWSSARRWIIASLTGLIAAMAALAGTALLFKQNQLLADQSELLRQQNTKVEEQTVLLVQQVELAEAARNASLAVEITAIAEALGAAADGAGEGGSNLVYRLDAARDLDRALVLRITSISRALKPYRFLAPDLRAGDPGEGIRIAMAPLKDDRDQTWAAMAAFYGWNEKAAQTRLVDRAASPERGQLLTVLVTGGLRDLEPLVVAGLDLSHAWLPEAKLNDFSAQAARLTMADFTGAYLRDVDLGGGDLQNTRFVRARIDGADFSSVQAGRVKPPLQASDAPYRSYLVGADFTDAALRGVRFGDAAMTAARFDGAVLRQVSFAGADLGLATFRGAVLLDADFTGASLASADFEGALIFGADALTGLAAQAAAGSFLPDRWELQPIAAEALVADPAVAARVDPAELAAALAAGEAFRIHRIGDPIR